MDNKIFVWEDDIPVGMPEDFRRWLEYLRREGVIYYSYKDWYEKQNKENTNE